MSIDDGPWQEVGATFSPCCTYRYRLWRSWDESKHRHVWVMLNPSTADEKVLDPTVRRCVRFSRSWGAGSIEVVNLFALRATDPKELGRGGPRAVGPDNDQAIVDTCRGARMILCAWGSKGTLDGASTVFTRAEEVVSLLRGEHGDQEALHHLGMTIRDRQPRHPLYVKSAAWPVLFSDTPDLSMEPDRMRR